MAGWVHYTGASTSLCSYSSTAADRTGTMSSSDSTAATVPTCGTTRPRIRFHAVVIRSISRVRNATIGALLPHLKPPFTQDQILTRHTIETANEIRRIKL